MLKYTDTQNGKNLFEFTTGLFSRDFQTERRIMACVEHSKSSLEVKGGASVEASVQWGHCGDHALDLSHRVKMGASEYLISRLLSDMAGLSDASYQSIV